MHIPQPKLHTVRYYGEYSSVARARRRAEEAEAQEDAGWCCDRLADRLALRCRASPAPTNLGSDHPASL